MLVLIVVSCRGSSMSLAVTSSDVQTAEVKQSLAVVIQVGCDIQECPGLAVGQAKRIVNVLVCGATGVRNGSAVVLNIQKQDTT